MGSRVESSTAKTPIVKTPIVKVDVLERPLRKVLFKGFYIFLEQRGWWGKQG